MSQSSDQNRFHLGFLWVASTDLGYVGGLLVTNQLGRPLEFQCTTPVRPNRTQEILYGSTLQPFIYSELIGKTLYDRLKVQPELILVAQEELLDLRSCVSTPVGYLEEHDPSRNELPDQTRLCLGRQQLKFHAEFLDDYETILAKQKLISSEADLVEPIERVKDALQETVRSTSAA